MTAMTPASQSTAIAGIPGSDHLGGEHLSMPRVKIVQPTSHANGTPPGAFYNTLLGKGTDELRVVPLRLQFGRVWFPKQGEQGAGEVKCASDDSVQARSFNVEFPDRLCAECPMSQWMDDPRTGQRIPPPCAFTYNYVLMDLEAGIPVQLTLSKTAAPTARQLNTMIKAFGTSRTVVIRTKEVQTPTTRYFVPVLSLGPALPDDEAGMYWEMAQSMATVALTEEAEATAPPVPEPPRDMIEPVPDDKRPLIAAVRKLAKECVELGASNTLLDPDYARMEIGPLRAKQVELERYKSRLDKERQGEDLPW